nr:hsp70-Hsp90 organizing protein 1-like [Quercus suber]
MRIYQVTAEEAEVISYFLFGGIHAKANKPHSFRGTQIQSHALAEQAKVNAYAAFSAGDFSTAVRHFSTAMSVGPSNYLLYSNRSAAYARLHQYSEALADAEKAVKLKPDWSRGYCRLGAAHLGLGHLDEAVTAYNKGLEFDPCDEGLKAGLVNCDKKKKKKDVSNDGYKWPLSFFEDMLSWPEMWHKLTANPTTQAYLQNNDFVRMMHELHNNYLKDKRVIQALGVLLNVNIWTPTSVDAEIPQSSSLLSLQPERKKSAETELAKELDLMELTADEGMDRESQACKEQEMGNAAYTKNDFDTAIAHYTKVMELDDGNISCLMNRAVAYLAIGQYDECIKDCDEVVERGRQLKSDSKMIAITLSRKGTALVKMAKLSKDYEPAIETFQKALSEHCIPGTLKKLCDAEQAKRELEQQEYFDTKLADEELEKGIPYWNT